MRHLLLRALAISAVVLVPAAAPAPAAAGPLGLTACAPTQGVYQCSGSATTWDGVPLDTTVTLPSANASGRALVVEIHGFGNSKSEYLDPSSTAYTDNAFGLLKLAMYAQPFLLSTLVLSTLLLFRASR